MASPTPIRSQIFKIAAVLLIMIAVAPLFAEGAEGRWKSLTLKALAILQGGEYDHARVAIEDAYAFPEELGGSQQVFDIDLAKSLDSIAEVYGALGESVQGGSLFLATLEVSKKIIGPIHPSVSESLDHLGLLYKNRGNSQQADIFVQRGLVIPEGAGPDVEKLARAGSLKDLAFSYHSFGQYAQADPSVAKSAVVRNDGNRAMMELLYEDMARYRHAQLPTQ